MTIRHYFVFNCYLFGILNRCDLPSGRFMCISDRGTLMRIFDIFEFTLPIVSIINNRKDHMLSRGDHAILITPLREIRNGLIAGIAPLLSPRAVLERVRTNVRPMSAFMLCGERWSGKTEVALEAARVFSGSPRAIAHVEVISCSALVGKPLRVILEAIQNGLERCYTAGTAVLLVDDVDLICPAVDDRETQPQNIESFVVAHHLELLLNTVMTNNMRSHTEARVRDAPGVLELLNDWLLASALEVVCVLFTAQSPRSVNAALLEDGLISRIFIIPILPSTCLCQSFFSMLHTHSISCELSSAQMEQVQLSLEGFRVGDLVHLSRSIHANTIGSGSSTLSVLNLLQLMRAYVPVSAEKLIKFDTGGLVCWADISGLTEAKATILSTFRRPLIFRKLYNVLPVKMPRAILLYGPPGSGKTMLASAAGNECGMSFAVVKGPELLDKYIGASEKAIRALFAVAKSASRPMLIFFDEFDALAPRRGRDNGGVTDRVVNQLLTFLDGVEDTMRSGGAGDVFVIAATSRPDLIDPGNQSITIHLE
jgi:peroxin-1